MCETCNPLCGGCKPAALRSVLCPECGKVTLLTREECVDALGRPRRGRRRGDPRPEARCRWCGAGLGEALTRAVPSAPCRFAGIVCGYPCGQRDHERRPGEGPCASMVPLARLG